ncbi:hypothetical protein SAMN04488121_1011382 [Chitinophaga filiformis]|uniref:Uncharacterized protein n=1 Tax=Chitinophaga filiformis TaxID=104663 RepID=A0A1G7JV76_CHIFI|nr:hypothetical protein SAMN04488121_1011382 [Chitinophaga filiformis]
MITMSPLQQIDNEMLNLNSISVYTYVTTNI